MDNKYLNEVLERLESYRKKEQQIELLRYELQHAKQVSPTELIEAMTFPMLGMWQTINDGHCQFPVLVQLL